MADAVPQQPAWGAPSQTSPADSQAVVQALLAIARQIGELSPINLLVAAPATAASSGAAGQIAFDASFFYVCVASNSWKRVAIAAW